MGVRALRAMTGRGALLYVGEWRGAVGVLSSLAPSTADHGMVGGPQLQAEVERHWRLAESVALPRWPGVGSPQAGHRLYVFTRRQPPPEPAEEDADAAAPAAPPPRRSSRPSASSTRAGATTC
mmetsp:Transcript_15100/g.48542  ORF Transcript_15100/g.48542 Transcript_15100/m.48542 type:complete len:123 (-) Transcript_15100:183-551(-)